MKNNITLYLYCEDLNDIIIHKTTSPEIKISGCSILSPKQVEFYLSNPNASAREVFNMKLEIIEIGAYKQLKIVETDRLSLMTSDLLVPSYQLENANLSIALISAGSNNPIYDKPKSIGILQKYNHISVVCRNERYRIVQLIESADTIDEINTIFESQKFTEIYETEMLQQ